MATWIIPETSRPLSLEEMQNNAIAFACFFLNKGWSLNAVCGILGNAQSESTINPNRWQGDIPYPQPVESQGFGLVQWTPWTKITEWLQAKGVWGNVSQYGVYECMKIQEEMENEQQWIATSTYPETFREYSTTTKSPYDCALEFLANYERPYDPNQPIRGTQAQEWYDYLKDKVKPFTPRLTSSGIVGSKYWYSNTNPFYPAGFGLPNCTCYAWGRAWEINGEPVNLPTGNANEWLESARASGFEIRQTPSLGDIICFDGGLVGTGHVAVVEVINDDGSIITSNSNYGAELFVTYKMLPPTYNNIDASLVFQGFIHYGEFGCGGDIPPEPIQKKKGYPVWMMTRNFWIH